MGERSERELEELPAPDQVPKNETKVVPLKVEDVFKSLGGYSKFQMFATFTIVFLEIPAAMVALSPILTGTGQVEFFCEDGEGNRTAISSTELCTFQCNGSVKSEEPYVSIVQEWQLYCDRAWITETLTSIQMSGALLGPITTAHVADQYGRKLAFYLICLLMGVSGILSANAETLVTYGISRFIAGFAAGGGLVAHMNYLMEYLTPSWRVLCGTVSLWPLGEILLGLFGYMIPSWRTLTWVTSVPALLLFVTIPFLPESPRWLLCKNKTEKAQTVFNSIAKWNSRPQPSPETIAQLQKSVFAEEAEKRKNKGRLSELKNKFLLTQMFLLAVSWWSNAVTYFGLSFNMKNMSGNRYLNVVLLGVFDCPAELSGIYFSNKFGRKWTFISTLAISSVFLAGLAMVQLLTQNADENYGKLILVLCLMGRFFNETSWAVMACLTVFGASIVGNDEFQFKAVDEQLDPSGSYILSWEVDLPESRITFEVKVATLGYVGFGISPSGSMAGADIFIAGVYENGSSYGFDMHSEDLGMPSHDSHSDWTLIEFSEDQVGSQTTLKFSRLLNTCDDEDYPISNDTVRVIWSVGETDHLAHHRGNRGTKTLNLLMPDQDDFNPGEHLEWDIETEIEMPAHDTTYWCSFHKAPLLNDTHHIIAFQPLVENELAVNHTHHFAIYKCSVPEGQNPEDIFEPYLSSKHPGADCYLSAEQQKLPVFNCLGQYVFVWNKGGKGMIFPEGVGYPFPEKLGENNYYMFEVHYDNPESLPGLTFKTGGRVVYTAKEIETEATFITVNNDVNMPISITIPPNQNEFIVSGHCSSQCTEAALSEGDGKIKIFNSLLHSHFSGRKMKVRQFRGETELPWLDFDNHYTFNFQASKPLRDLVEVRRGDQITVECTYNTTWNDNKAIIGGISSRQEMCMALLWYYPKQKLEYCGSYYPDDVLFQDLGITNYTVTDPAEVGGLRAYTIVEPPELAGDYLESLNNNFKWNETFIREFERKLRYNAHGITCIGQNLEGETVKYPENFVEYVPEDVCKRQGDGNSGSNMAFFMSLQILLSFSLCAILFSKMSQLSI
ncbi:unnamed protein product [Orchesella dallaii]|uniref:DOMON domain-containing protein n=1 Tax=Orchesella dallaii TaxID=48710 RepID=A0ABP1QQ91_9HEXA